MSEITDPETSGRRRRILLADDHELLLEQVATLLQSKFDVVGTARNGLEMVSEALRLMPDIIVADISMPGLSGIEATRELHERGSTAKVVFLTVHPEAEFVDACVAEGASAYVAKSHIKRDLIPAVNAALAGRWFVSPDRKSVV